jgi:hypothetical protein
MVPVRGPGSRIPRGLRGRRRQGARAGRGHRPLHGDGTGTGPARAERARDPRVGRASAYRVLGGGSGGRGDRVRRRLVARGNGATRGRHSAPRRVHPPCGRARHGGEPLRRRWRRGTAIRAGRPAVAPYLRGQERGMARRHGRGLHAAHRRDRSPTGRRTGAVRSAVRAGAGRFVAWGNLAPSSSPRRCQERRARGRRS